MYTSFLSFFFVVNENFPVFLLDFCECYWPKLNVKRRIYLLLQSRVKAVSAQIGVQLATGKW